MPKGGRAYHARAPGKRTMKKATEAIGITGQKVKKFVPTRKPGVTSKRG